MWWYSLFVAFCFFCSDKNSLLFEFAANLRSHCTPKTFHFIYMAATLSPRSARLFLVLKLFCVSCRFFFFNFAIHSTQVEQWLCNSPTKDTIVIKAVFETLVRRCCFTDENRIYVTLKRYSFKNIFKSFH